MASTESVSKRLKAAEADKGLLRAQLSSLREDRSQKAPRRRTVFLRTSSDVGSSIERVTEGLTKSAKQASHSPLLDIFTQYDRYNHVFDNIYQRLGIKDVIAISRTCKRLSSFYTNMLPCQWNINQRLARFVNDPKEFRSRLGQADALISGTFALLFFAQLYWLDSGLDIYVQEGSKADALIRYIGEDKRYKLDHSYDWSDNDQHRTLTKVSIFRRIIPPGSPQIRFHLTRTSPLHSILTDCAFSTAHVNIITWNKAYCMFPNVTFVDRRMYFLHTPDEAMEQILSKYSAHGWRTSDWVDYDQARGCNKPGVRENLRRIGDSSTWIIPLNLYKIRTPGRPDSVLESCTFQIFPDSEPSTSQHIRLKTFGIGAQTFSCCILKYTYTFHAPDANWMVFLREKLSRMIMIEVLKTGDANLITRTRQPDFMFGGYRDCPLLRSRPRFQRPDGWECVDHMLPAWLEEWRSAEGEMTREIIDLILHPLTIVQSKGQPGTSQALAVGSVPPPVPPRRARKIDTDRLLSKPIPASRSSGLQSYRPQLARSATSPQLNKPGISPQTTTPPISPGKQKAKPSSLTHRRPKVSMPPPLDLSSMQLGPLIPDLLTPPPDSSLPATLTGRQAKRSPVYIPSRLMWGSSEKSIHNISGGHLLLTSDFTGFEKMFPEDMVWI